jgi:hypothetical protein
MRFLLILPISLLNHGLCNFFIAVQSSEEFKRAFNHSAFSEGRQCIILFTDSKRESDRHPHVKSGYNNIFGIQSPATYSQQRELPHSLCLCKSVSGSRSGNDWMDFFYDFFKGQETSPFGNNCESGTYQIALVGWSKTDRSERLSQEIVSHDFHQGPQRVRVKGDHSSQQWFVQANDEVALRIGWFHDLCIFTSIRRLWRPAVQRCSGAWQWGRDLPREAIERCVAMWYWCLSDQGSPWCQSVDRSAVISNCFALPSQILTIQPLASYETKQPDDIRIEFHHRRAGKT